MDSVTHLALGACTGELLLGKRIGKKALFWGALSQSLPDIDVAGALFYPADKALLIHRGLTHSFFFAVIMGAVLGFIFYRVHPKIAVAGALLFFFFCFELMLHDMLDVCNAYGTGLLEPFSHRRFSINLLYVADPFFTFSLVVASLLLPIRKASHSTRATMALTAIFISIAYLGFSFYNKLYVDKRTRISFMNKDVPAGEYFTTPAPFNSMLWYIVIRTDKGFYTGYSSIWDDPLKPVTFETHRQNNRLLGQAGIDTSVRNRLLKFAGDDYTLSSSGSSVDMNILRFQQVQGWEKQDAPFAFSYPLTKTKDQYLILQRGRLAGWDRQSFKQYLKRIAGE